MKDNRPDPKPVPGAATYFYQQGAGANNYRIYMRTLEGHTIDCDDAKTEDKAKQKVINWQRKENRGVLTQNGTI